MLFRKRSRLARDEAQWRAEVTAQLTLLMRAQTQAAEFARVQLDERKSQRPGLTAWLLAVTLLVISASLAYSGIIGGVLAPLDTSNANSLFSQSNTTINRANQVLQSVVTQEKRVGAAAWFAHATKADLNNLTSAGRLAIESNDDFKEASADQASADRWQLEGPGLLVFGSALGGAVLGWILTQCLGLKFLRWPEKVSRRRNGQVT
jgi:hypothetical protein